MIKVKRQTDPELAALVDEELNRQEHNIEMIASESTAPLAAKTWSFKYAASQEFHDIMAQVIVNAKCLAEELQKYGFRIGLTAVSQRGLKEPEIREIAAIINQVAEAPEDEANLKACKAKAEALIAKFPLYPAGSFDD